MDGQMIDTDIFYGCVLTGDMQAPFLFGKLIELFLNIALLSMKKNSFPDWTCATASFVISTWHE